MHRNPREFEGFVEGSTLMDRCAHTVSWKSKILLTYNHQVSVNTHTKIEVDWIKSLGGVRSNMIPPPPTEIAKICDFHL